MRQESKLGKSLGKWNRETETKAEQTGQAIYCQIQKVTREKSPRHLAVGKLTPNLSFRVTFLPWDISAQVV